MREVFKIYRFLGPKSQKIFITCGVLGIVVYLLEILFIQIIQAFLLALGILKLDQVSMPSWFPSGLTETLLVLIFFGFFRFICSLFKSYLSNLVGVTFLVEKQKLILRNVLSRGNALKSAEVLNLFSERLVVFSGFLSLLSGFFISLVLVTALIITGLNILFWEFFISLLAMMIFVVPMASINKKFKVSGQSLNQKGLTLTESLVNGMRNFFLIQAYRLAGNEELRNNKTLEDYEKDYRYYNWQIAVRQSYPALVGIVIIAIVTLVSFKFFTGDGIKLMAIFYLFTRIASAVGEINSMIGNYSVSLQNFNYIYHYFDKHQLAKESTETRNPLPFQYLESIRAENLAFSYSGQAELFKNIGFQLKKGEVLLIKGKSGRGKSTLVSLLIGLLKPSSGKVFYNDSDLFRSHLDLSPMLGYVGPEPFLLPATVRENLFYGQEAVTEKSNQIDEGKIWSVLDLAGLKNDIIKLPQGLDSFIDEHAQLSTGQKQRLSLARALLRDPQVLILDEATANLDSHTENQILDKIELIRSNIILIVVSHKSSFDRIATINLDL